LSDDDRSHGSDCVLIQSRRRQPMHQQRRKQQEIGEALNRRPEAIAGKTQPPQTQAQQNQRENRPQCANHE